MLNGDGSGQLLISFYNCSLLSQFPFPVLLSRLDIIDGFLSYLMATAMTDKIKRDMINQDTINKALWSACDTFRGTISADTYKDFILTMLFLKGTSKNLAHSTGNPVIVSSNH